VQEQHNPNPRFLKHGYIQVYTGDGKGKTTASIGLATRALGRGWSVLIMHFCKNKNTGEYECLKNVNTGNLVHMSADNPNIPYKEYMSDEMKLDNLKAWWYVIHNYKKFDLIILDELNIAIELDMIHIDDVIKFLHNKPKNLEVVITGRHVNDKISEVAHLVTEMRPVKHYWDIGVKARKGIEF
jgi:cob(I)alamin adenosyltransferase